MATFFGGGGADADAIIAEIVDSAPSTLNTLNELAAALNDDASFATTVTNSLSSKASTAYVDAAISLKQDSVSGVSSTEIGYLDGVTSAIQTQIDGKAAKLQTNEQINQNFTLPAASNGKLFYNPWTNNHTIIVNPENIQVGEKIDFLQVSTGKITISFPETGIAAVSDGNKKSTNGPGTAMTLICYGQSDLNKFVAIVGNLS